MKTLLHKLGILWGVLAIVVGTFAMWGGTVASADAATKYPICHATESHTNPYTYIEVAASAINDPDRKNDHMHHTGAVYSGDQDESWGDIIPPYEGVTAGLNWPEGQAIFANGCSVPAPSPSPSASPTPTPSPSPSASPTPTPTPSSSPTPTPSATPTPTPSATPTPTPSATPTPAPSPTNTGGVLAEVSTLPSASTNPPTGGGNPALPIGLVLLTGLTGSAYLVFRSRVQPR